MKYEEWEGSLYPLIKFILENSTDEEVLSDDKINDLNNRICQEFDKKYLIIKRKI